MVIVVEIEDRCAEKPFLGGWKNVVTGTEYHDARTQTCPGDPVYQGSKEYPLGCPGVACVTRTANVITQTHAEEGETSLLHGISDSCSKYTSVSTVRATQTSRLPDLRDKLLTPLAVTMLRTNDTRSYRYRKTSIVLSSTETQLQISKRSCDTTVNTENHFSRLEEECAIKIQKCYRAYRARLHIEALARLSRETRAQTPPEPEKIHHLRHCGRTQFEIVNAPSPNKRSDLELLENVLGRWRVYETARIDRSFFGTSKLAARTTILLKEIELLRSIEAIKTRVKLDRRQRKYLEHLDKLAQPEVWNAANGKKIHVYTLRVQRARECREFYATLLRENLTTNERIDILKNLRKYTLGHTCRFAHDVTSLVDQELELLSHAVEPSVMVSLRNRLKLALLRLSLNFCEPERRIDEKKYKNTFRYEKKYNSKLCTRCGKFLKLDDFPTCTKPSGIVTCENCRNLQSSGKEPKVVYEPYELMLKELRSREASYVGTQATVTSRSPAFAVDPRVIYRLVNYVWHGKSGISECDDLFRLTLVRFRAEREWSPWNTLVLTKREAALHQAMPDPWQIYSPALVKKFVVKNLQAKLRFDFLTKITFSS